LSVPFVAHCVEKKESLVSTRRNTNDCQSKIETPISKDPTSLDCVRNWGMMFIAFQVCNKRYAATRKGQDHFK
jgi:hypothetical protein